MSSHVKTDLLRLYVLVGFGADDKKSVGLRVAVPSGPREIFKLPTQDKFVDGQTGGKNLSSTLTIVKQVSTIMPPFFSYRDTVWRAPISAHVNSDLLRLYVLVGSGEDAKNIVGEA
jgi:hypothetical protein